MPAQNGKGTEVEIGRAVVPWPTTVAPSSMNPRLLRLRHPKRSKPSCRPFKAALEAALLFLGTRRVRAAVRSRPAGAA